THSLVFSSDTGPWRGEYGLDAMKAEGFLDPAYDPLTLLVKGKEDIVFWEAGGTNGDPIHFDAREWARLCAERNLHPTTVFMHAHPMPPELRGHSLARPGMVWNLITQRPVRTAYTVKLASTLASFKLADASYWMWQFLCQGEIRSVLPDTTVVAEGERADGWYIVLQGRAVATSRGQHVGTLEDGAFFGELDLLGAEAVSHNVTTSSPTVLLRIPPDIFREFVVANNLWNFFPKFWKDVHLLSQTRVFFGFPHEVVSDLARSCQHRHYPAGATIIEQGATDQELFVVAEGTVSVHVRQEDGRLETVGSGMGVGEILGEYGALLQSTRSATVRADSAVEMLVLDGEHLDRLLTGQLPLQLRLVSLFRDRGLPMPSIQK
ncbi:MAG TPA: cyclic nucleotide-binding domain-containing protein, partial [Candidatus Xenobia bacterium]